jgi:hypothetical protein
MRLTRQIMKLLLMKERGIHPGVSLESPQASLTVTDMINHHPTELPLALWPPTNNTLSLGLIRIPPQPFHTPVKHKHHRQSPDHCLTLSISSEPELSAKNFKWEPKDFEQEPSSEPEVLAWPKRSKAKLKHHRRASEISNTHESFICRAS